MNPPANPARFIRGRGRGGGAYRPYFYFRRNGKTIPAGSNDQNAEGGPASRWSRGRRRRGGGAGFSKTAQSNDVNNVSGMIPPLQTVPSFLRSEFFAAPEDAEIFQSITIETNEKCPGWRLYFYKENYDETSTIAKRIKTIEKHYTTNERTYDFLNIQATRVFRLDARIINADSTIKEVWPDLMDDMQKRPLRTLATFGVAMYSIVTLLALDHSSCSLEASSADKYVPRNLQPKKIYVRPINFCDLYNFSEISNENLDNLISLRGHVISVGEAVATANWICYKCSRCTQEQALRQTGSFTSRPYACKRNECHARKGFIEMRSSEYTRIKAMQTIRLMEHCLLDVDAEQRETINIELSHDLVDCIEPGQDLKVIGILKMGSLNDFERNSSSYRANSHNSNNGAATQIYLRAITVLDATNMKIDFTERDLNAIAAIMGEADSFKLLVHSIAPEVYGQEMAKAGLLLALSGGAGTQLHDESDVNVLLVGDPGTGKSNMLQMCTRICERGNFLNKKQKTGSSTIASCVQGRSQHVLNFGALTNALNGHIIIDDVDRLASGQDTLLQMLQSQCLTLPFNGVYGTEVITTSLIASANPIKGHYDHSKLLTENVRISPSLCAQFHLVFVLCDKPDKDMDTSLTEHIQRVHAGAKKSTTIADRYAMKPKNNNNNSVNTHSISNDNIESIDDNDYELLHRLKLTALEEAEIELLPTILIKKFLLCARQEVKPLLNVTAAEALREFFINMLKDQSVDDKSGGATIGSSQLAGLIRLSQARARLDFSVEVTKAHVRDVICIVRQSMSDTEIGDYVDLEQSMTKTSRSAGIRKFLSVLRMRSGALNRRVFELQELKEIAIHAGISSDFSHIIDAVNLQGFLLKKGSNIYEMTEM